MPSDNRQGLRAYARPSGEDARHAMPALTGRCGPSRFMSLRQKPFRAWPIPEPGKSDARRSVSWLAGHRAACAFPGFPSGCSPYRAACRMRSPLTVTGIAADLSRKARTAFPLPACSRMTAPVARLCHSIDGIARRANCASAAWWQPVSRPVPSNRLFAARSLE